jgi:mannose-6-phosphate isomerase-like protein (cupin superfamily)
MKVDLTAALESVDQCWSPKVIAAIDQHYAKVAKLHGEFCWHKHDHEDELFLVLKGSLCLQFKDRDDVTLGPGELYVVPKGILHNPVADDECHVLLIERQSTLHTGETLNNRTKSIDEQLSDFQA